jgi:hypothetical protein
VEQPRVVWRKPLWQRIVIGVLAVGLDVGMVALIATGSAGAWQPWFFLVVFTIGLAGWWLPKTVLDDDAVTSRSVIGLTRRVPLDAIKGVGYGPLGVWIDGIDPPMILHAIQGIRPLGGAATSQQSGPSGQAAVAVIRERALRAGAQPEAIPELTGTPSNAASLWSRLR